MRRLVCALVALAAVCGLTATAARAQGPSPPGDSITIDARLGFQRQIDDPRSFHMEAHSDANGEGLTGTYSGDYGSGRIYCFAIRGPIAVLGLADARGENGFPRVFGYDAGFFTMGWLGPDPRRGWDAAPPPPTCPAPPTIQAVRNFPLAAQDVVFSGHIQIVDRPPYMPRNRILECGGGGWRQYGFPSQGHCDDFIEHTRVP